MSEAKKFIKNREGPQINHLPQQPLETLSVDLMGPLLQGEGGVHNILVLMNTFLK